MARSTERATTSPEFHRMVLGGSALGLPVKALTKAKQVKYFPGFFLIGCQQLSHQHKYFNAVIFKNQKSCRKIMTNKTSSLNKNKITAISEYGPILHLCHLPVSKLVPEKHLLSPAYQRQIYETQRNRKYPLDT